MKYKTYPPNRQPVKVNSKSVGYIKDGVFETRRRGSKHIYRKVPGWAISMSVLEELDDEGIQDIRITDIETGMQYSAKLSDFQMKGVPVPICLTGDPQLCLPLFFWNTNSPSELEPPLQETAPGLAVATADLAHHKGKSPTRNEVFTHE